MTMHYAEPRPSLGNPFDPGDDAAFRRWRDWKLDGYPERVGDLVVEVRDPEAIDEAERAELHRRCRKANMAVYVGPSAPDLDKAAMRRLGQRFGLDRLDANMLSDDDGISPLAVADVAGHKGSARVRYIPYTDRPIAWHTDGYYNASERQVCGLMLHCVRPAAEGGFNDLLDHEIAYIRLREESTDLIAALMRPDAMTIPANQEEGEEPRPDSVGPVFSVDARSGALHMRYTFRTRSIAWSGAPDVKRAAERLRTMLDEGGQYFFRHRLDAGQGLISNNVLHTRTAFTEDAARPRLLYRARYFDRIAGTASNGA